MANTILNFHFDYLHTSLSFFVYGVFFCLPDSISLSLFIMTHILQLQKFDGMYVFLYLIESLQMDQNFLTLGKKLFRFSQRAGLVWRWLTNTFVFLWIGTGWLLMSVDCNLFLMGPKISKSAKTQLFLGSLSWEVLVFWCFKTVRCAKICL